MLVILWNLFLKTKKRNDEVRHGYEFAVFCIENVAAKLGMNAERVYRAFTKKSNILNGYIVPEYEALHTQSREYIVDDLLTVMKERGVDV